MRRRGWFDIAFAFLAVANVLPLFASRFLPFVDLPEHVAVMGTLRHWVTPGFRNAEHYLLDPLHSQYLLYHLVGAGLTAVVGTAELANKLLLAATGVAHPYALASLLTALGRDRRLAVFGMFLFWNRALGMGFLPFVASVPVVLYGLALAVRQARSPSRARAVGLGCLALATFYLHVSAFVLFVPCAVGLVLVFGAARPLKERVTNLLWVVPAGLCAAGWSLVGRLSHGDTLRGPSEIGKMSLARSMRAMPLWQSDLWTSHVDEACAFVWWSAFFVAVLLSFRKKVSVWLLLPLAVTIVTYLLTPHRVGVATMLNVRLAVFVALFAVLPLHLGTGRRARAVLATVALASLVGAGDAAYEIRRLGREEMSGFDELLERVPLGARLVSLNYEQGSPRRQVWPWPFIGSYHRALHGGVASYSFTELAHWPLQYRPESAPPKKRMPFWIFDPSQFEPDVDGRYYDYVLARGEGEPGAPFCPVARAQRLTLYGRCAQEVDSASRAPSSL